MENINSYMQDQLKHYVNILSNMNVYIHNKPIAISSANYAGFPQLQQAIKGKTNSASSLPKTIRCILYVQLFIINIYGIWFEEPRYFFYMTHRYSTYISDVVMNQELFPFGLRRIPSLWIGVHDTVEKMTQTRIVPFIHIDVFKSEVSS